MKKFFLALLLGALTACSAATASVEVGPSPCVYSSLGYMQCVINSSTGYTVIWPAAQGAASSLLLNDGSGNLSWSTSASFVNPMMTFGDMLYENTLPAAGRLAGNTSATKNFLSQTGTGAVSATPAWVTIAAVDVPSLDTSKITTGVLPTSLGGLGITTGTSGGVLAFTGTTTLSSSNALTANGVLYGGGVGFTPGATAVNASATNKFLTQSSSNTPAFATIAAADVPNLAASIITTGILPTSRGGLGITTGTSGGVLAFTGTTTLSSSNVLTANGVLIGGGAGATPTTTAAGTTGQSLVGIASSAPVWRTTAPTQQIFTTSSGTYTTAANVTWIRVRMVGPGGGGASSGTASTHDGVAGSVATTFGTTLLSAGAGGGGGSAAGSGVGGSGGTSSLGSGPTGIALTGGSGQGVSVVDITGSSNLVGGNGASTPFGGAGGGGGAPGAGLAAAANTGGGGGGAGSGSGAGNYCGSGGGAGGFVDAIITTPTASYVYVVGAGGAGGSAGTSGSAGAAGGSGYIVVEEHYQ